MKSDVDIIHEYVDQRISTKLRSSIIRELFERQSERKEVMIPNVSSLLVEEDGYLKTLGVSAPQDLILENFGELIASIFSPPSDGLAPSAVDVTDSLGGSYQIQANNKYPAAPAPTTNKRGAFGDSRYGACGNAYAKLGSSATAVTRTDYNVNTAFGASPESGLTSIVNGAGFSSGTNSADMSVIIGPFGASQTAREGCIFKRLWTKNSPLLDFAMLRYNYSDTPISSGASVTMDSSISI